VVEHGEVEVDLHGPVPLQLGEPRLDLPDSGWVEARPQEDTGQGVHVVPEGHTAMEGRLQQRRASSHEGVVDDIARLGPALDEEPGQLRLEARPVGDLVERVRLPLGRRPVLADESRNLAASDGDGLDALDPVAVGVGQGGEALGNGVRAHVSSVYPHVQAMATKTSRRGARTSRGSLPRWRTAKAVARRPRATGWPW